jgi:hypothetical protein
MSLFFLPSAKPPPAIKGFLTQSSAAGIKNHGTHLFHVGMAAAFRSHDGNHIHPQGVHFDRVPYSGAFMEMDQSPFGDLISVFF